MVGGEGGQGSDDSSNIHLGERDRLSSSRVGDKSNVIELTPNSLLTMRTTSSHCWHSSGLRWRWLREGKGHLLVSFDANLVIPLHIQA